MYVEAVNTCCGIDSSNKTVLYLCTHIYPSMLWSESLLHTVCPLLQASLKTLSTEASTSVLPATFRRRRPLIHWVVCSLAGGHSVGAVTSCIRSVAAGKLTSWIVHVCMWYAGHIYLRHMILHVLCMCVYTVCGCVLYVYAHSAQSISPPLAEPKSAYSIV